MTTMTEVRYRQMQLYASAYKCLKSETREGELQTVYAESVQWLEENLDELVREMQEIIMAVVKHQAKSIGEKEPEFQHVKWVSKVIKIENVPEELRSMYQTVYKGLMRMYFYEVDLDEKLTKISEALAMFGQNYELIEVHLKSSGFTRDMISGLAKIIEPPPGETKAAFSRWAVNKARSLPELVHSL